MLAEGRQAVVGMECGRYVMWVGLAVSYILSCRASELWAYAKGQVHPEFCLTRKYISFFYEGVEVAFDNRAISTAVLVKYLASKYDKKKSWLRHHANAPRAGEGHWGASMGAYEALLKCWMYTHCTQRKRSRRLRAPRMGGKCSLEQKRSRR